jgi:TRAP-type C4-dicarboxylate transport system substrate-binding protein
MKTNAQFSALRKGALDMSAGAAVVRRRRSRRDQHRPDARAGAELRAGRAWKTAEVGKLLAKVLDDKGVIIVSWIWQAGGVASRAKPLVAPDDAKGMKVRGGSREMDMMLKQAGASVITLPSNEIYAAMQTGAMDAAMTSSHQLHLVQARGDRQAPDLRARNKTYWFMFEPLMISKDVFGKLPKAQQDVVMAVGAELEKFRRDAAKADDKIAAEIYAKAGAKVYDIDEPTLKKWQAIAATPRGRTSARRTRSCAALLKAAQKLL